MVVRFHRRHKKYLYKGFYINYMELYKCKYCGKEFDNPQKLGGHVTQCKENPNHNNVINQLNLARKNIKKENKHLHCKYCNKEIANAGCLSLHERYCEENPNKIKCNGNYGKTKYYPGWNKGLKASTDKRVKKYKEIRHQSYLEGKIKLFTHHSEETKKCLREKSIEYIERTKGKCQPRYNINGCKYINKLNEQNNWHLQHAENGGEIKIDGYYLDGYDKDLNIVFEYDESKHYKDVLNNILNDKDIERQNYIISKLNCDFYRYNEYLDYFYKVN